MSNKSGMKKLLHDLSNKIMILEGYLSTYSFQPEDTYKDILAKCETSADGASDILIKMRKQFASEEALTAILYCSKVNDQNNVQQVVTSLEHIEKCAHTHNAAHNITGYLLYIDGYFIQYIEGNSDVIKNLYLKICLDPRHKLISLLSYTGISTRAFQSWQKVFTLNRHEVSDLPEALDAILSNNHRLMSRDESLGLINFVEMLAEQRLVAEKNGNNK
jgi:hypothetical protein